jgi:hypothetical protein
VIVDHVGWLARKAQQEWLDRMEQMDSQDSKVNQEWMDSEARKDLLAALERLVNAGNVAHVESPEQMDVVAHVESQAK